ncbi:hypothetical protein SDC9_109277 [bioreactor metagenome]|uniref:Uncharacterized protein n=1 Tax=bioreactor metagenome TaxID=1076179 RepID=A0A645BBD2_9ZZZZ
MGVPAVGHLPRKAACMGGLALFQHGKGHNAHTDQRHRAKLQAGHSLAQKQKAQQRGDGAGRIADG